MTYNKLPGVYFSEEVSDLTPEVEQFPIPMFVIRTEQSIEQLDAKLKLFNKFTDFNYYAREKGLDKSIEIVKEALDEIGANQFYIYSMKVDANAGITRSIAITENRPEIKDIFYIEETPSTETYTLNQKLLDYTTALETAENKGAFKHLYCIPYGSISAALTEAGENAAPSTVIINTIRTATTNVANGRISIIMPDYAGVQCGKIHNTPFDEDIGLTGFNTEIGALTYKFSFDEMVTLQNMGVIFIRDEIRNATRTYKINLGVTTNFKNDMADGLLVSRRTADELLNEIRDVCTPYIKRKEHYTTVKFIQTDINAIVQKYKDNYLVTKGGTKLTASGDADANFTLNIAGTIQPIKSTLAIEVNTTLN